MSLRSIKRVSFFCPTEPTGGPEAIHQASQALNAQGMPSDIVYVGNDSHLGMENGRMTYRPPTVNPSLEAFRRYDPVVSRGAVMRKQHLIVLPEVHAGHFGVFRGASVAVWWLSVDNLFVVTDEFTRRALFSATTVRHWHQSAYAQDFLQRQGIRTSTPLADYTTPEFTDHVPTGPNPSAVIAYNPVKGADLSSAFFSQHPEHRPAPIQGMTKAQIVELLRGTRVYVDFGHLPGKDRLPREAAASGAVVFVRRKGAGAFAEDFPLPDLFRFDDRDVTSGELARRVAAVQADPAAAWAAQADYRRGVLAERDDLHDQVATLIGRRRAA
ncbi:hypothetical protein [Geodermatophilus sp. SYSU D01119]